MSIAINHSIKTLLIMGVIMLFSSGCNGKVSSISFENQTSKRIFKVRIICGKYTSISSELASGRGCAVVPYKLLRLREVFIEWQDHTGKINKVKINTFPPIPKTTSSIKVIFTILENKKVDVKFKMLPDYNL